MGSVAYVIFAISMNVFHVNLIDSMIINLLLYLGIVVIFVPVLLKRKRRKVSEIKNDLSNVA